MNRKRLRRPPRRKDQLIKKLLRYNFEKEKEMLVNLRTINKRQLKRYLKGKNLAEEAKAFKREKIDGYGFIILFTDIEGMEILEQQMGFDLRQVDRLKKLYHQIFQFRSLLGDNFHEDEIPIYTFKEDEEK